MSLNLYSPEQKKGIVILFIHPLIILSYRILAPSTNTLHKDKRHLPVKGTYAVSS
jgi:hypothetical protein